MKYILCLLLINSSGFNFIPKQKFENLEQCEIQKQKLPKKNKYVCIEAYNNKE
ncbi:MAG: hypothetical protein KDK36_22075 [Leptospiraceae bacterium]|nr:hypothetical protein [Leptospiraceae bacterium]